MFQIGEFSKMTKTTVKTLRYYDETGLLKPQKIDRFTNYRFYTTDQLLTFHRIQALRQVGLSIEEIKAVIDGKSPESLLQKRKQEILSEIDEHKKQLSRIEFILSQKEEDIFMNYQAIIKVLPECTVYSKTLTLPDYASYFDTIPAIGKAVSEKYPDLKCSTPEYCFNIYLDGEYKEKDIRMEFCEAVDKARPDFDDIVFKTIKSTKAVSVMHKGPYEQLGNAYTFAYKWIKENNYTPSDFPRESYIDGIWNKENKEDWLTEIQIPIE